MNPVIEELLQVVNDDPLPGADTSSHWQHYGGNTVVERDGDELLLLGSGFGSVDLPGRLARAANRMERLTYWRVVARLASYTSIWRSARRLADDVSAGLTFDVWKQAVALAILSDHWAKYDLSPKTVALIGDGHGFLGALIHRHFPESRIYSIDLPKAMVFQARTYESSGCGESMSLMSARSMTPTAITFVRPKDIESISDEIDCAINIASMQEMTNLSIASYFDFLRRRSTSKSRFYCVNREQKELVGGEVTRFDDYPWHEDDRVFIDGPCPYYTHYIRRTEPKGSRVLGVRVPFVNHFDGKLLHRLVRLAPA